MLRKNHHSAVMFTILLSMATLLMLGPVTQAQDEAPDTPTPEQLADPLLKPADVPAESQPGNAEPMGFADQAKEKEEARAAAMVGLILLGLICFVFVVLIVLIRLWARRLRMQTSQPLPDLHPGDPLWYLRKGHTADTPDVAELSDGGSSENEF
jgi:hypothetical protein